MTVAELIKKLEVYDGDQEVRYDYDWGYAQTPIEDVLQVDIKEEYWDDDRPTRELRVVLLVNDPTAYDPQFSGTKARIVK